MSGANDLASSTSSSRKYRQFTLDGSHDVDIAGIGGGACRGMILLSQANGDLTTTPANPITGDEPFTVTNLPPGTPLPIVATAIKGGLPSGLIVGVFW